LTRVKGSPFAAGGGPTGVAVDPTGKFAYVTNEDLGSGSISAYAINAKSGALTQVPGSPFPGAGNYPWDVAIYPSGKFAYVTNEGSSDVAAYAINARSGALTQVRRSPFAAGTTPIGVAIDPSGKFAYVANEGYASSGNVSAYAINARSGALTQVKGSPFSAGIETYGVAIDPTGKFAYATNYGSDSVSAYAINAKSGALTQVPGSPFAAPGAPTGVAIR
jgi:6-phosphogluconolactonase